MGRRRRGIVLKDMTYTKPVVVPVTSETAMAVVVAVFTDGTVAVAVSTDVMSFQAKC